MEFQFIHRDTYPEADGDFPNITTNTKAIVFNDSTTWDKVLDEFISFLGSVYGYDIRDKVSYKTLFDKINELSEDYPEAFEDEDPFDTEGREFR